MGAICSIMTNDYEFIMKLMLVLVKANFKLIDISLEHVTDMCE